MRAMLTLCGFGVVLAACGPAPLPSRATAERLCEQEAREADGISGRVGIGTGSDGPFARSRVSINSNILDPVSQADALEACIQRRLAGGGDRRRSGLTVTFEGGLE